jgi:hypothetical protein
MRRHLKRLKSFRLPNGIVMWSRGLSVLYGLVVELAPGLRPLDVLGPYVLQFLAGAPAPAPPVAAPAGDPLASRLPKAEEKPVNEGTE